jgi:hypothetical protein
MSKWNQDLAEKRRKVHRLINDAKRSGNWTEYKRSVTDYKALRQTKRESRKKHCDETEMAPEYDRLDRILSKCGQSAVSYIQLDNGGYTTPRRRF